MAPLFLLIILVAFSVAKDEFTFVKKGDEAFNKGKYSEAIKYYNSAIEINPTTRYLYKRGEVRFLMKRYSNAVIDLKRIVEKEPEHVSSRRLLGKIFFQTGKYDEAEEHYSFVVNIRPEDRVKDFLPKIQVAKQRLTSIQTDDDRIRVLPHLIKEFSPESREFRLTLAETAIKLKNFNLAKPEIHWLLKRDPKDGSVRHLYACKFLYEAMGEIDEGKTGLKKCLDLDPGNQKCLKCFKRIKKLQKLRGEINEMKESGREWKAVRLLEDYLDLAVPEQYDFEDVAIEYCETYKDIPEKEELALTSCEARCSAHPRCKLVRAELMVMLQRFEEAREVMGKVRESHGEEYKNRLQQIQERLKLEEKKANRIDFYKLFNISKRATTHEIKKAYKKMALKFHPDRARTPEQKKEFSTIMTQLNQGVELLTDEEKRARYDQGDDINDIFGNKPSGGGGGFHGSRFHFNFNDFNFGGGGGGGGFFRNF